MESNRCTGVSIRPAKKYKIFTKENWEYIYDEFIKVIDYMILNQYTFDIEYITNRGFNKNITLATSKTGLSIVNNKTEFTEDKYKDLSIKSLIYDIPENCKVCNLGIDPEYCKLWTFETGEDKINRCEFIKITTKLNNYYLNKMEEVYGINKNRRLGK